MKIVGSIGAPSARSSLPGGHRSHLAVSYYGANVFPDTVIIGLEQPATRELVTGKFVLEVREDDDRNRALWIAIELSAASARAPPEPLGDAVADAVLASLRRRSRELANDVPAARQRPRITLWLIGHPEYLFVGVNQAIHDQPGEPLTGPDHPSRCAARHRSCIGCEILDDAQRGTSPHRY